jgi:hypothetical protein
VLEEKAVRTWPRRKRLDVSPTPRDDKTRQRLASFHELTTAVVLANLTVYSFAGCGDTKPWPAV